MRKQGVCGGKKGLITFGDLILHHCIGYSTDIMEALVAFPGDQHMIKCHPTCPSGGQKRL